MYRDNVDKNNFGLKCCGIVYASVGAEELNAVATRLRKNRNVPYVNCEYNTDGYNLQFSVIANNYSHFEEIVTSQCNFDVKFRYGYLNV
jgi:hypothetical protein